MTCSALACRSRLEVRAEKGHDLPEALTSSVGVDGASDL